MCDEYRSITRHLYPQVTEFSPLEDYPHLPVSLFKSSRLASIPEDQVFREVRSSGTSGQQSVLVLDKETSRSQTAALLGIMKSWLGGVRRPMVILDSPPSSRDYLSHTASSAAVTAMMMMGRDYLWLLDEAGEPNIKKLREWLILHHQSRPVFFGFTFRAWKALVLDSQIKSEGISLDSSTLIHGGGWKKMIEISVTNQEFKSEIEKSTGISEIRDYYGMAEQLGGVWIEGEEGVLIPSKYSHAIIRDPISLEPSKIGQEGVIQSFSTLTGSYPGHSLLTEDFGVLVENKYRPDIYGTTGLRVLGRIPKSEPRGCSDTLVDRTQS